MTWLDAMVGVPVPVDLRFVAPRGLPLVPKGSNSVLGSVSGLGAALMRARIDVAALKEDDLLSLASIPQPPSDILMLMTIVCVLGGGMARVRVGGEFTLLVAMPPYTDIPIAWQGAIVATRPGATAHSRVCGHAAAPAC